MSTHVRSSIYTLLKFEYFHYIAVGEASGKGPRGLATRLPGSGGLQHLQAQAAGTVAGDVSRARMVSLVLCTPTPTHTKGPRGLATRLPGSGGLQHLQAQAAGTVAGDVSRARMVSFI